MTIPPQPARRVLLGYKRPGDDVLTAYTADGILPIRPEYRAAPADPSEQEHTMTQQPVTQQPNLYTFNASGTISVSCTDRPAREAAEAARGWALMIDPYVPDDEPSLGWVQWLKALPLLRVFR